VLKANPRKVFFTRDHPENSAAICHPDYEKCEFRVAGGTWVGVGKTPPPPTPPPPFLSKVQRGTWAKWEEIRRQLVISGALVEGVSTETRGRTCIAVVQAKKVFSEKIVVESANPKPNSE